MLTAALNATTINATCGNSQAVRVVHTYGEAAAGELVALWGSSGRLEFAVTNGSAAERLGVGVGTAVCLRTSSPSS
jgi:S-adenosylmethionine hydrolase